MLSGLFKIFFFWSAYQLRLRTRATGLLGDGASQNVGLSGNSSTNSGLGLKNGPLWAVRKSEVGQARERDPGDRPSGPPGGGPGINRRRRREPILIYTSHSG